MALNRLLEGISAGAQIGQNIQDARYNSMLAPLLQQQDFAGASQLAARQGRAGDVLAFQQQGEARQRQFSEQERAQAAREMEEVRQKWTAMSNVVRAARRVPEGERPNLVAQVLPQLQAQGVMIDPSAIRPEMLTDQGLQMIEAQLVAMGQDLEEVGREFNFTNVGGTLVRTDKRSGEAMPVFEAPQRPDVPAGYRMTPDGMLQAIPGGPADPSVVAALSRARPAAAGPSINVYTGELTASNQSGAQEALRTQAGVMQRLGEVRRQFEQGGREFLGLSGRAQTAATGVLDYVAPGFVSAQDRARLQEAQSFKTAVMTNFNETLRDMSGAAVTASEYDRIRQQMPNLNDGPSSFQAKMETSIRLAQAAIQRQQYFLQQGIPFSDAAAQQVPLEQFLQSTTGEESLGMPTGQGAATVPPGSRLRFNPRTGEIE